jgi:tetratricopeptide (TPR) repeat protein
LVSIGVACSSPSIPGGQSAAPDEDSRALLKLEQIRPAPWFPKAELSEVSELPEQGRRHVEKGRGLFDQQRWTDAAEALEKALQEDPRLVDARILLARAFLQEGRRGPAESQLREALRYRPKDVAGHQLLGEISWQEGETAEAIRHFRLALMAGEAPPERAPAPGAGVVDRSLTVAALIAEQAPPRPERVLAHLSLAMALRKEGYLTAAENQLAAYLAATEKPTPQMRQYHELNEVMAFYRGRAIGLLAEIQTELQNHDQAAATYRRALAQEPGDDPLRTALALSLAKAGRAGEALEVVQGIMDEAFLAATSEASRRPADETPLGKRSLAVLEEVCKLIGEPGRYDAELVRLAEQTEDLGVRVVLAEALLRRDRTDAAIGILEPVVEEGSPGGVRRGSAMASAGYLLARLYLRRGEVPESLEWIIETLRDRPASYQEARAVLAEGGLRLGSDKLLEHAQRLSRRPAADAAGRFVCGQALLLDGQKQEALRVFEAAARLDRSFAPPFVALAGLLVEEKEWPEAIAAADAALGAGIHEAEAYLLKGRAHDALDEHDQADAALLEAFRQDRKSAEALFLLARSAGRRAQLGRCERLYRRILDEVDPRFVPAREKLVRLYLDSGLVERAKEYSEGFADLGLGGAAADRCRAYLNLQTNRAENRLGEYRAELRRIITRFPQSTRTYVDLAITHFASREYRESLVQVARALEIDPQDIGARELRAELEVKLLRFNVAAETYDGLLKDRPADRRYLQRRLEQFLNQADFDAAARRLRQLLDRADLGERRAFHTGELVQVLMMARRYDQAVETAKRWLEESSDSALARAGYLSVLGKTGRHDEAVDAAAGWLAEDPTNLDRRRQLVGQLRNAERHAEAQRLVLSWLAGDPDDLKLNEMLIRSCWPTKQWGSAIALAQAGAEQARHETQYKRLLLESYVGARRYDQAVALCQDRLSMLESYHRRPGLAGDVISDRFYYEATKGAYRDLILTLLVAQRHTEAEQVVHRLLLAQLDRKDLGEPPDVPWVASLRQFLTRIFRQTDRLSQAIQQLELIYALAPNDPGISNDLGYTWADAGIKLERADRLIRFAVGEKPRESAYLDSLGWVLYKRGEIDEAVRYLRLAVRQADPADPVIHDHLGDALYRAGLADEARDRWSSVPELLQADGDAPLDADEADLLERIEAKLGQLAAGEEVQTAVVVGPSATRPAPEGE